MSDPQKPSAWATKPMRRERPRVKRMITSASAEIEAHNEAVDEAAASGYALSGSRRLSDADIKAHGDKASCMMARDMTRFDAACEVMRYLKNNDTPYYYTHRMSIVLHGNDEGTAAARACDVPTKQDKALEEKTLTHEAIRAAGVIVHKDVDKLNALSEQIKTLEADAKRYQWLLAKGLFAQSRGYQGTQISIRNDLLVSDIDTWDANTAIDAAIKESK